MPSVAALGGPDLYLGRGMRGMRGMREVHEGYALRNEHFGAAVNHLLAALREVGISDGVTSDLAVRLEPLRTQIVSAA